ncbi:MAG: hypothetical protein U0136_15310 [Bdellovibrionota bacterium]
MRRVKVAVALPFLAVCFAVSAASADSLPNTENTPAEQGEGRIANADEARFMLGNPPVNVNMPDRQLTANDFTWGALTKNGPANGSNPIVGSNAKPYYDFKDGQPYPYYIVPSK